MSKQDQHDWVAPSPGSWSFDGPPNNHIVWSGPGQRVCFLTSDGPTTEHARLIAAAPELLEVVRLLVFASEHFPIGENHPSPLADDSPLVEQARAALAKAGAA